MNKTKKKLNDGQPTLGGWTMIGHPAIAEIIAGEGLDWVCVDLEHTSLDLKDLLAVALALKGTGCDLLARLPSCDPALTKQVLDLGAAGIIVPAISGPAQAAQAVAMAKFPPEGIRGASLCRAADYGRKFKDYFSKYNGEVVVAVMIENCEGVAQADAILSIPGIDAAFIGPYDLSASMGLAGQLQHPDVLAAQEKVLSACVRNGVVPGIHVVEPDGEMVRQRLAQGFRFIACGLDTLFIQKACRDMLKPVFASLSKPTAAKSNGLGSKDHSLPAYA